MTELRYEVMISAARDRVWDHLATADGLTRWMAIDAEVELQPGGVITWTHANGATMVGRFVQVDPPSRLAFTYGWVGDLMGVSPGSTIVDIELTELEAGTCVTVVHRGLPDDAADDHRTGWNHFLGELVSLLS